MLYIKNGTVLFSTEAAVANLMQSTQPAGIALDPHAADIAAQLAAHGYYPYVAPTVQPWQTLGAVIPGATYTHAVVDRDVEAELKNSIDMAADAARVRLISPGTYVCEEYTLAFEDATKYAAAGYTGDVPGGVLTWAQAQGWTNEQACNDILYQKAAWKYASDQIRALRLNGKAEIAVASTAASKWAAKESFVTQLNALFA